MSIDFHNYVLLSQALSYNTRKYRCENSLSKRTSFLNGFALLLNGSNVCTVVYPWLKEKVILIARNEKLENVDRYYFDQFFSLIRVYSSMFWNVDRTDNQNDTFDDIKDILINLVNNFNQEKIMKRLFDYLFDDAVKQLLQVTKIDDNEKQQIINSVNTNVGIYIKNKSTTEYACLMKENMTVENYISFLLARVERLIELRDIIKKSRKNPLHSDIRKLQNNALLLYESTIFKILIVKDPRVYYYIDKISAHMRALNGLLKCFEQDQARYAYIYREIKWRIINPHERCVLLNNGPTNVFRMLWSNLFPDIDPEETVNNVLAPNLNKQYDISKTLDVCVHCELLLIDYLLKNQINEIEGQLDVEIGISKMSCYLCSLYIAELNKEHKRIFCLSDSTHGKVYQKWDFIPDEQQHLKQNVERVVIEQIEKYLNDIQLDQKQSGVKHIGDSDTLDIVGEINDVDTKYVLSLMKKDQL
ncbi:unnamed protein product [Didymodactylos carnosus]|uniref:Uncharacterized protein n=1 Tax=Didymodactylos carnosus TaxID=1234261 RepID=A0A815BIR5_9BILA|nr:unnamed protein product [Didymodactylos carnosus]CAF1292398.1 unnamed protein product [Didymodactylos carnosus]CAF4062917.1 unnamed protein product [Didymodactylos carnosus]CAF4097211.1 unnamed protein product [Didymodactylos carnosus]